VKHFFKTISSHPSWEAITNAGIIRIPLLEDWESQPFVTQIIPVLTAKRQNYFLSLHLTLNGYAAFPIDPPVVPTGTNRVRLVFKASNSQEEVEGLVNLICAWGEEMLEMKKSGKEGDLPTAARQVYTWTAMNVPSAVAA
jgi:8-amino-7-oxononanoate synthase